MYLVLLTLTAPGDYDAVDMIITFPPGSTSANVFVPTVADGVAERTERFNAELTNPTGGAVLGDDTTASVDIMDGNGM